MRELRGSKTNGGKPQHARCNGTGSKKPSAGFAVLVGKSANHYQHIDISCRVQPANRQGRKSWLHPGRLAYLLAQMRRAPPGINRGGTAQVAAIECIDLLRLIRLDLRRGESFNLVAQRIAKAQISKVSQINRAQILQHHQCGRESLHQIAHPRGATAN